MRILITLHMPNIQLVILMRAAGPQNNVRLKPVRSAKRLPIRVLEHVKPTPEVIVGVGTATREAAWLFRKPRNFITT